MNESKSQEGKGGLPHIGDGQAAGQHGGNGGEERHEQPQQVEVFVQGEGVTEVQLLKLPGHTHVSEIITIMRGKGLAPEAVIVLLEDQDGELPHHTQLHDLHAGHHHEGHPRRPHLHCHRCHQIQVSVAFNTTEARDFPPSATVGRVKEWADKTFELKGQDATDFGLQVSGTGARPDEDIHIGTLVKPGHCQLQFTLARKKLVQG